MEDKNQFKRQIAIKIDIDSLNNSEYVVNDEQTPNYLLAKNQEKIYRLNLIATIIEKEKQGSITNLLIDDGTGSIVLRSFEENKSIENLNIGDVILTIGKIRVYNQERYISPEIVKKIDNLWLKIRSLDLMKNKEKIIVGNKININENNQEKKLIEKQIKIDVNNIDDNNAFKNNNLKGTKENNIIKEEIISENIVNEKIIEDNLLPVEKIINIIKELDKGDGAPIEEIIEKSPLDDTDELIKRMMEKGDIFQNLPGKVKVL